MKILCNALEAQLNYTKGFTACMISGARLKPERGGFLSHYAKLNTSISQGHGSGIATVSCSCRKAMKFNLFYVKIETQVKFQKWQAWKALWRDKQPFCCCTYNQGAFPSPSFQCTGNSASMLESCKIIHELKTLGKSFQVIST